MKQLQKHLCDADATEQLGAAIANCCTQGAIIELHGDLGAGKTTLVRGVLHAYGHTGAVKSPTYTLVEPYHYHGMDIYHFDLYRLGDPDELEYMGIRDYFREQSLSLIEWPQRGQGMLPVADIKIQLSYLQHGRDVMIDSQNTRGDEMLLCLSQSVFFSI